MDASSWGLSDAWILTLAGALAGTLLGLAARLGRFCALGAIEDGFFAHDGNRARMWGLAIAVGVAGAFLLEMLGVVDLTTSIYMTFEWNPLGSVIGGLVFGYGMALVGTCGFGSLARLGGGDFRGLVVALVVGVSGYMALRGPLAAVREMLFPTPELIAPDYSAGIAHSFAGVFGVQPAFVGLLLAMSGAALLFSNRAFAAQPKLWIWGVVVGLAITLGWAATGLISAYGFVTTDVRSLSYVAPTGEALLYAMTSTAQPPSFAVGSVLGVVIGSAIGSLWRGEFRWEACDDARELRRQIVGAALMGVGGVVAFGCTVGQGLSAASTLSFSAPIVIGSIVLGAWLGLRQMIWGVTA